MTSHSNRARAWCKRWNVRHGSDAMPLYDEALEALAAEFEALLPEGSVAVDRDYLNALEEFYLADTALLITKHEDGALSAAIERRLVAGKAIASSPDCPLGGDDVSD